MKAALLLTLSGALLSAAQPLEKRKVATKTVEEWQTVYVTEGSLSTLFAAKPHHHSTSSSTSTTSTSTTSTTEEPTTAPPAPTPEAPAPTPTVEAPPPPPPPAETPAAAPPAAPQVLSSPSNSYSATVEQHHNVHRLNHSSPTVSWSDTYAGYAATLAARCVFQHDVTIGGGGYGQNLAFWGSTGQSIDATTAAAQAITNMWYNGEISSYPSQAYGQPTPDMTQFESWGHFSQVVWAGSTSVGCQTQLCPAGTMDSSMDVFFTVCNYYPAGNVDGRYGTNVLAPSGEASVTA